MMGWVYGLVASDEPNKIRYVGSTMNPAGRLAKHRRSRNGQSALYQWIASVYERGETVDMLKLLESENEDCLRDAEVSEHVKLEAEGAELLNRRPSRAGRRTGELIGPMSDEARARHTEQQRARRKAERIAGIRHALTPEQRAAAGEYSRSWHATRTPEQQSAALRHARAARVTVYVCCVLCQREVLGWNMARHVGGKYCVRAQKKLLASGVHHLYFDVL